MKDDKGVSPNNGVQPTPQTGAADAGRSAATHNSVSDSARTLYSGIASSSRWLHMSIATKQLLREAVEHLPDDATVEDAMDRLYFLAKVARGLDAADRGDVVSHEEAQRTVFGGGESDLR